MIGSIVAYEGELEIRKQPYGCFFYFNTLFGREVYPEHSRGEPKRKS